jgi:hypothetical protein
MKSSHAFVTLTRSEADGLKLAIDLFDFRNARIERLLKTVKGKLQIACDKAGWERARSLDKERK